MSSNNKQQHRHIQRLQKQVAEQITSQQIIPTLHQCIKQLIDNAIDAKATIIKIQLQQYGKVTFTVFDNGTGIKQVQKLGEGGNTSKLSSNHNSGNYLEDIRTLGFRGQAVNSIANLCKQMTIQTVFKEQQQQSQTQPQIKCTQTNYSVTQRKIIDKKHSLISNTFTKITVTNLFYNIPVRKYQLQNKPKQNLKKVYQLLFEISLIFPQITFILINSVDGKQELLFQAQRHSVNKSLKKQQISHENYFLNDISKEAWKQRIQICFPQKLDDCLVFIKSKNIEGFVLNTIQSGSSKKNLKFPKNLQYTFINRRPVNPLKQVCKIFDSYYKKYNPYTKYVFFLNIKVEPNEIDVNLSPNKRDIFIKKQRLEDICKQIKQLIEKQVVQKVNDLGEYKEAKMKKIEQRSEKKSIMKKQEEQQQQNDHNEEQQQKSNLLNNRTINYPYKASQSQIDDSIKIRQQVFTSKASQNKQQKSLRGGNYLANYQKVNPSINTNMIQQLNRRISTANAKIQSKINLVAVGNNKNSKQKQEIRKHQQVEVNSQPQEEEKQQNLQKQEKIQINRVPLKITQQLKNTIFNSIQQSFLKKQQNISQPNSARVKIENYQSQKNQKGNLKQKQEQPQQRVYKPEFNRDFNLQTQQKKSQQIHQCHHQCQHERRKQSTNKNNNSIQALNQDIKIQVFEVPENINYVTEQNRGQITKKDFKEFHIHGQFNKGFILCSLKQKQYLYIIDQHASQQKRLFESFMQSKPTYYYLSKEVQLTPIQVDQIEMAREELTQSGFTFTIENRTKLKIMRCPTYFKKNFGLQEFMQIAQTKKTIEQIPSFYNSAASKACRTAVMIGDQLGKNRMIDIVHKMSELKSPWNCPHGRPSLISLGSFESIIQKIKTPQRVYKF